MWDWVVVTFCWCRPGSISNWFDHVYIGPNVVKGMKTNEMLQLIEMECSAMIRL